MAQAVEHYEIAGYGTLRTWAEQLGLSQSVEAADATLEEEKETDRKLTELAQSEANPRADTVYRVVAAWSRTWMAPQSVPGGARDGGAAIRAGESDRGERPQAGQRRVGTQGA